MRKSISSFVFLGSVIISLFFVCNASEHNIRWTEQEKAFIAEHPVIRLGVDPAFVPFEFINESGEYVGIAPDYLRLISERSGLEFEVVHGLTWPEAYNKAVAGEIDALPSIGITEEREKLFLFSDPYYHFKRVIVTRIEDSDISGMNDLDGLTVAVQRNSSQHSYLLSYPKINLSLYDSVESALTAVAIGTEKAFLGNLSTSSYLIRSNGLTNLRFVSFEAEKSQALYFAARKEWPELISIFNKALESISETEKVTINSKWVGLKTDIDYSTIIRLLVVVGTFIFAIIGVSFFWVTRLRKEIQQRRRVQIDLEEAKRLADEANEFKSGFMARMSHEIRTPLNAITGMAYLLKKTSLTLTQKMYADRITQASSNMLNIINDILDYSKIEAGKVELESVPFSLDQIIQNVVNIASYKIEEQEIEFKLLKDSRVPNWFFGDSKRIEQVLLNLLNNAVKFTHEGEVSLDIRLISIEDDQYHISFEIKDTGIGMNDDQVKNLFQPFIQGDSSINRRFGGSGLGLSIVKNLVDLMKGHVQVRSTQGEGSTFIIQLSLLVDKEKEDFVRTQVSGTRFKDIRTLVLDKSGTNLILIESYLSSFGMHCESTTSQMSALNMLEDSNGLSAEPFDLFVIDYESPEEGGLEFIEAVRNNKRVVVKPKFIVLLPIMREDLFDKINEHKIDLGIGKPIIPSILLNGILDLFNVKAMESTRPSENQKIERMELDLTHRVLVAEDNKTNQLIVKSLLQQIGIETIIASDGKEAVERFAQYKDKIVLVLMDLHMPVMNGYEAAEKIRENSSSIPIIAMTADVIEGVKEKCEQSGIYLYLSKPFDPDQFLLMVKNTILESTPRTIHQPAILDVETGMRNIGGSAEIYQQIIKEYARENIDTPDKLSLAILEKRYGDAVQIVHKVKSSSGSIGAKSLYDLSVKLQKALDDQDESEITILQQEFTRMLRQVLNEISAG